MKKRIAYIVAVVLLICANAVQIKANGHFASAKKRIAQLTANLPASTDRSEIIRNDDIRNDHVQRAQTWARPGFAFAGLGMLAMIVAMIRKEKGWYSMPILLLMFYGMLTTAS